MAVELRDHAYGPNNKNIFIGSSLVGTFERQHGKWFYFGNNYERLDAEKLEAILLALKELNK